ncbi:hypothetical protein C5C36_07885 [Rathayibacter sp. AY1G1]|uniref:acyltransferase family protein n=1 Tax=unclassified Rathayibacter TaxID=2609250 RepID=UPI000CE7D692|nr:hypothetical protein C5C57_08975 [Rathayibacter sp. AY1C5]PPH13513.1 hypothetical protein C5C36_07885 [Rathayibacter sp. AY1G1]
MQSGGTLVPGRIPSLDGLRAVAIAVVVWGHAGLPTPIKGSTGVTLFFFLSGYLITHLMRVEAERRGRISLRDFYLRRTRSTSSSQSPSSSRSPVSSPPRCHL